jgi:hypothetical protein
MRLVELTPTCEPEQARVARYRVQVGEVVVEVDDTFRDETLARLLAVVAAC